MLQYRNTPCRILNQSPAQILLARNLKDGVPCVPGSLRLRQEWIRTAEEREVALARKHVAGGELWSRGVKSKTPLKIGSVEAIQNMIGKNRSKWNLSGTIVDTDGPESYWIKMDGSGRLTKRKRQNLREIAPFLEQLKVSLSENNDDEVSGRNPRRSNRLVEKSCGGKEDSGGS